MTTNGPVILFSGQGGFDGVALHRAGADHPQVKEIFTRIDDVTGRLFDRRVSDLLFGAEPVDLRRLLAEPRWVSQVAILGSGLAAYEILADHGVEPAVLAGHSLGEITALVAAGAYTVEDGAAMVIKRVEAAEHIAGQNVLDGRMLAVAAGPERTRQILQLLDDPQVVVAVENHDEQTVVSGPAAALEKVRGIARQLAVHTVELEAPLPFHSPLLADAVPPFAQFVRGLRRNRLHAQVYSPVLLRYYTEDDDVAGALAEHFVLPVRFGAAIRALRESGHQLFIEAGGRDALTQLVHRLDPTAVTMATLSRSRAGGIALEATLAALDSTTGAPTVPAGDFEAFWRTYGTQIVDRVRDQLGTAQAAALTEPVAEPAKSGPVAVEPVSAAGAPVPGDLFTEIRSIYAEALEYPEDVFTGDVSLEGELGVDSVKQIELLTRISRRYGLPQREADFRLFEYDTLDKVVGLIRDELGQRDGFVGSPS